eukprot:gnl/TRDRNA2_/TRDRNA2_184554_c0_seq1.p1 gnl/TRDRNA2_/TRDRNA2_184554_c0~~gnl/TRDRNA2_/TRDRNA2_184554_c0_seq1.p1  ORF type:complete len:159 (+),score=11.08 gnl/TRDRNA2_/TRDRNA2_184554_c0_seq1:80-556(+)
MALPFHVVILTSLLGARNALRLEQQHRGPKAVAVDHVVAYASNATINETFVATQVSKQNTTSRPSLWVNGTDLFASKDCGNYNQPCCGFWACVCAEQYGRTTGIERCECSCNVPRCAVLNKPPTCEVPSCFKDAQQSSHVPYCCKPGGYPVNNHCVER